MADELMQTGIFEGMTWWNTNPAKSFLLAPYCSMAVGGGGGGVDGFASVGDHLINHNRSSVAPRSTYNLFEDPPMADSSLLQAMAFDASTWNSQDIMHGGSCDGDYVNNGIINPIMDAGEWNTSNTCGGGGSELNCSSSPPPAAVNSSGTEGSTVTCDGQVPVVNSFPVDPAAMFQNSLLNGDHEILIPSCEWISTIDHNQVLDSSFNQQQRQEQIFNHLRATLLGGSPSSSSPPSPKPQSRKSTNSKVNKNDEGSDSGSVGSKNGGELSIKRQRIETPSSLPTFKVRKEKLGDRITALQQLVSPFGKTDTASVLHEAIEYIKFLHDQVNALSTPYMKNGAPVQHHQQGKGEVGTNQDLSSRGLCLMPISSTFPVAHDSPADFWTPTFGATFR